MKTEFITKGFQKTEAMDQFVKAVTLESVESFLKNDRDVHFRVLVNEDSHRNQSRRPHFICEVLLKTAASKKMVKVTKASWDFREAVSEAGKALKSILRRRSDRKKHYKFKRGVFMKAA